MLIANSDKEWIFYDIVKIKKNVANQLNGGVNTLSDNISNNDSATTISISNSSENSNTFEKKSLSNVENEQKTSELLKFSLAEDENVIEKLTFGEEALLYGVEKDIEYKSKVLEKYNSYDVEGAIEVLLHSILDYVNIYSQLT